MTILKNMLMQAVLGYTADDVDAWRGSIHRKSSQIEALEARVKELEEVLQEIRAHEDSKPFREQSVWVLLSIGAVLGSR